MQGYWNEVTYYQLFGDYQFCKFQHEGLGAHGIEDHYGTGVIVPVFGGLHGAVAECGMIDAHARLYLVVRGQGAYLLRLHLLFGLDVRGYRIGGRMRSGIGSPE